MSGRQDHNYLRKKRPLYSILIFSYRLIEGEYEQETKTKLTLFILDNSISSKLFSLEIQ